MVTAIMCATHAMRCVVLLSILVCSCVHSDVHRAFAFRSTYLAALGILVWSPTSPTTMMMRTPPHTSLRTTNRMTLCTFYSRASLPRFTHNIQINPKHMNTQTHSAQHINDTTSISKHTHTHTHTHSPTRTLTPEYP